MMFRFVRVLVVLGLATLGITPLAQASTAPISSYIVVFNSTVTDPGAVAPQLSHRFGGQLGFVYSHAIKGFSVRLSSSLLGALQSAPGVAYVVPDTAVTAAGTATIYPDFSPQVVKRQIPRIGADQSSTVSGDGAGEVPVNIAVLDTGIDLEHNDLNVVGGINCANPRSKPTAYDDAAGHGTMVAGFIGASDNTIGVVGVAPGARLWAVRVLNNNALGTESDVLCGIDWVTATRTDADPSNDIQVANMSLAGTGRDDGKCGTTKKQDPEHQAICASTAAGVTYVVGAANDGTDFQNFTPAAYDEVLTATAMTDWDGQPGGLGTPLTLSGLNCPTYADDSPAGFSDFATLAADQAHTVAAPGVCITSTYGDAKSDNIFGAGSGTSFAAPQVTGTVALCIYSGPCAGLTPAQIITKIVSDAAAYNTANPSYGFTGDPLHNPDVNKYYGYLIRAALY
jgi:subtilisin